MLGKNAGAQLSCLGGCLLRSAPTRETLGTEVDYIKARALQVGFVIPACRRVVILFAQKSAVPRGGAGSCAPARPLWGTVPWTHVGAAVLRSFAPRHPPRQIKSSVGPFSDFPGRVSGGAQRLRVCPAFAPPHPTSSPGLYVPVFGQPSRTSPAKLVPVLFPTSAGLASLTENSLFPRP